MLLPAAVGFAYLGWVLALGYVGAQDGRLTVREGLRVRRIDGRTIAGLEICDARLFIAGQKTIGVLHQGEVLRLNLLAVYPTKAGLRRLQHHKDALARVLGLPSNGEAPIS